MYTLWAKNFAEIALSRTVQEIQAILSFTIFVKNSKWLPFLDSGNFFLKNVQSILDTLWAKNFAKLIICELFLMNTT